MAIECEGARCRERAEGTARRRNNQPVRHTFSLWRRAHRQSLRGSRTWPTSPLPRVVLTPPPTPAVNTLIFKNYNPPERHTIHENTTRHFTPPLLLGSASAPS